MSNVVKTGGSDPNNATSSTTFGRSVESQAQMKDAQKKGASTAGELLNVYRLVPIAEPDDPNWQNAPSHGEIVVAARTAGDARIVAAARELDYMEVDSAPAEDVSTANASAFRSEKLYTVVELEHGRHDLRRGVLEGQVRTDNIKPTQS
ncbi:hypothetical protein [Rhizobium leucaenae]|jgi:hypothetical protein|uniref:Uncharacterized protein n=1 Tax=Rhizobium leucaenae TaxID=29450 RepID=A0A7W6ZYE0_9HYPH|nr:hypothetical protein [Rhizobium leucaenae]MBB4570934.1 hypothetical protein [Rhizobium leucaenae]